MDAANLGIKDTNIENKTYMEIYRNHEKAYTKLVNKRIIHEIIEKAADEHGTHLVPQHEYFRIDNIGYKHNYYKITEAERDDVGLWRHLWDLKIAVEHENSKKDWMDEVVKLIHIRCPLKIVIAYNNCDMREDGDIQKLDFIAKWMPEVAAFDKNAKEEFLIIIGKGKIGEEEYTRRYLSSLNYVKDNGTLDILVNYLNNNHRDIVLLCYENPEKFCHRHILADFLNKKYNLNIKEL